MKHRFYLKTIAVFLFLTFLNWSCSPSLNSLTTPNNLLGMIGNNTQLSSFSGLLNKVPSVGKLLGGKNPLTILAPTNEAVAGLGQDALTKLTGSKDGLKQLGGLLKNHMVSGIVNPSDLTGGTLKSLGGGALNLGDAKLVGEPIKADNGMIQMIDKVLQ